MQTKPSPAVRIQSSTAARRGRDGFFTLREHLRTGQRLDNEVAIADMLPGPPRNERSVPHRTLDFQGRRQREEVFSYDVQFFSPDPAQLAYHRC